MCTRILDAPRETVWSFIENQNLRELWWPGTQLELSSEGTVSAFRSPQHSELLEGKIDVLVAGHVAGFVWAKPEDLFQTSALIALHSYEQQTKLNITELGFNAYENSLARARESYEAWKVIVDKLEKVLQVR